eukprot:CAMPEP_0115090914 /NCGR_PEP_ID=MMETSP0227-20121206/25755_1 /TAXON_ID=89957 /ORGANISM="Polarella glacialis, Strain CCMP 1383" /LENGTH=97 /DNA_ID=CAMNT_0002482235 /DNA_START=220 /DNA_END=515 /DNA_ORIENTATION=+
MCSGVGDHKGHGEVVVDQELVPEVVLLDHPEVVHWLISDGKFQGGAHSRDVQELRSKVVSDEAELSSPSTAGGGASAPSGEVTSNKCRILKATKLML